MCVFICICICIHVYIYIYIYINETYQQAYMYTHISPHYTCACFLTVSVTARDCIVCSVIALSLTIYRLVSPLVGPILQYNTSTFVGLSTVMLLLASVWTSTSVSAGVVLQGFSLPRLTIISEEGLYQAKTRTAVPNKLLERQAERLQPGFGIAMPAIAGESLRIRVTIGTNIRANATVPVGVGTVSN